MMIKMSLVIIADMHEFPYLSPAMEVSMEYVYWIFPIACPGNRTTVPPLCPEWRALIFTNCPWA